MNYLRKVSYILLIAIFCMLLDAETSNISQHSQVFFTPHISAEAVENIFQNIKDNVKGNVAIKVHFGEDGNNTFLDPKLIKGLTQKLDATLVETNVLYVSKRRYTESHIKLAKEHGFDFAPIDILDSEGEKNIPARSAHFNEIKVGKHMDK